MKIPVAILSFSLILTPIAAAQSADASPALEVAAAVKKEIDARQRVLRELAQFKKHKDLLAALDSFSIMCAATIKETLERRGGSVSNDDMQNHDGPLISIRSLNFSSKGMTAAIPTLSVFPRSFL